METGGPSCFLSAVRAVLLSLLLLLPGCPRKPEQERSLISEVRQKLTERDERLQSYRLAGVVREQGQEANFEFEFRQPNKMRGRFTRPVQRTFSWDGQRLYERVEDEKRLITYELKLPPQKSALFLTQTFGPFTPEGFRVPLMLQDSTAARTTHRKAAEAVELQMETKDEEGALLAVRYLLRWPSLDFLSKRSESSGQLAEVRVEEEHCEQSLGMCFPKQLTQWRGNEPVATTVLSKVEINPPIAADSFTLTAPEGFEAKLEQLVEE